MREPNWSKWVALLKPTKRPKPEAGIYQIRWAINGEPQAIPRANAIDETGILYMGKTVNLENRIDKIRRGITRHAETGSVSYTHTAVYTYTFFAFAKRFKPHQLEVRWATLSDQEIDLWEQNLLHDYAEKNLDKPPLNNSIRRM